MLSNISEQCYEAACAQGCVSFHLHALWLQNNKRAFFHAYKLRSNSYIVVYFSYLEVESRSLDGATKHLPVLSTQAHRQIEWRLLP